MTGTVEWFKLSDYPYFKALQEYARLKTKYHKHGPEVANAIAEKGPILSCVLLFLGHNASAKDVENMERGVKDFVKLIKAAPNDVLDGIDGVIAECSAELDDPLFSQLVELERQRRRGELKEWGTQFDGRKVSVYTEKAE